MSEEPSIKQDAFFRRLARVQEAFEHPVADIDLSVVDAILIVAGASSDDELYKKSTAFQTWLLGYEFPSTLSILTRNKVLFLAGSSRTQFVSPLVQEAERRGIEFEVLTRGKDPAESEKLWRKASEQLQGKKVGVFAKDKVKGKFVDEWQTFLQSNNLADAWPTTDIGPVIASIMAVKEADEIAAQELGAKASMHLMNYFAETMFTVIDEEEKITHEKLAERVENQLDASKLWKEFKSKHPGFEPGLAEWCYTPILQSGGDYDLRPSAQSDDRRLKPGVILCSLGIRYRSYCSNMGRTFIIDPHKTQQDNYLFLCKLQTFVLEEIRDGVPFNAVYQAVLEKIQSERPDLLQHFNKSMGFLTGIEFKENSYNLNAKCVKTMRTDMVLSLNIGFENIPDPKTPGKVYALLLADSVRVGQTASVLLSDGIKSAKETQLALENEPTKPKAAANGRSRPERGSARTQSGTVKSKLRQKDTGHTASVNRRKTHQAELAAKKQAEGEEKYRNKAGESLVQEKQWKRFESYQREGQLPADTKSLQITVDPRKQTVILPINGFAVPFHIKTIKNAIKQEEGEYTTIRIMFITPGQLTGKKEDTPFEDLGANFIRALTYRSSDMGRFNEVYKEITELRKEATKRENERAQMADLVEQEKLIEGRRARLVDTWLRPSFEGKRSTGDVEIHQNGIRWVSKARSDHKLDITFSNVKHLFFQPCDHELIVLIHVHLKAPIMLGKKKVKDISFFREATDTAFDETGNRKRRRQHEEDEIEMEQEERKQRGALNREFSQFAEKIARASNGRFEVDTPFRELAFSGVPFKTNVSLQPTTDCLVHLSELPVLVITLADIEVAHLERVQYGLNSFDLVFIFSDFTRPPVHINTIPSTDLENVKDWLDSVDIATTEGPVNLQWTQIMKTVNEDPHEFFQEGGWHFLQGGSDQEDPDEPESEGSAFSLDEEEFQAEEEESDYSEAASASDDAGSGAEDEEDFSDIAESDEESDEPKRGKKK